MNQELVRKSVVLAVVVLITLIVQYVAGKALRRALDVGGVPQATIFVNIVKALIWFFAVLLVLQPVFDVAPTSFVTALGVTSIVISIGMQDTISNLMGGLSLMMSKVIKVGDIISVNGKTGTVEDITWRNTVLSLRDGGIEVIPNSVLSKTALTKLAEAAAESVSVDFTVRTGSDLFHVEQDVLTAVAPVLEPYAANGRDPIVRFGGIDASGISGKAVGFVRSDVAPAVAADAMARAIATMPWLAGAPAEKG